MPQQQQSSSTTVFSLPELLEAILIALGKIHLNNNNNLPNNGNGNTNSPLRAPVTQLFPLQRINHTFTNVIRKSMELRSMMGLMECGDGGHDRGFDRVDGLTWFMGVMNNYLEDEKNFGKEEEEGGVPVLLEEKWRVRGASWRDIHVCSTSDSPGINQTTHNSGEAEGLEGKKKKRIYLHCHLLPPREGFLDAWTIYLDISNDADTDENEVEEGTTTTTTLGPLFNTLTSTVKSMQDKIDVAERKHVEETGQEFRVRRGTVLMRVDFERRPPLEWVTPRSQWPEGE